MANKQCFRLPILAALAAHFLAWGVACSHNESTTPPSAAASGSWQVKMVKRFHGNSL